MATDPQTAALLRQMTDAIKSLRSDNAAFKAQIAALQATAKPLTDEDRINAIQGNRKWFGLTGNGDFDANAIGTPIAPITFDLSQDGPFIWTHFPLVTWKPTLPNNADNLGRWSPVSPWPLATQEITHGDVVSISWTFSDGDQRQFQTESLPPLFSRPDYLMPLPKPTLIVPAQKLQFQPIFEYILFNSSATHATTNGKLKVVLPGFKIVNL